MMWAYDYGTAVEEVETSHVEHPVLKLATPHDLPDVMSMFTRMLQELVPLGHNVLPTPRNLVLFSDHIFSPALEREQHGIVIATVNDRPVGCTFITPDISGLDTPGRLAVTHGLWVAPDHRREGLARKMQASAHARLQDLGYTHVVSTVLVDNVAGLKTAMTAGAKVTSYFTTINLQEAS